MRIVLIILLSVVANSAKSQSPSILDLVVIGKDTIVASTHDMSIIVSHDGGKSWKTTERQLIKQLGLDGRRIWGIDSWIGIHERSYSRLFYSDDIGVTWKQIELNTDLFFAMEFIEIAGKLWIVDDRGNLWEHRSTNVETSLSWKKRTNFDEYNRGFDIYAVGNTYSKITSDTICLFNVKNKKYRKFSNPVKSTRLSLHLDTNTVFLITNSGAMVEVDLKTLKFSLVARIEDVKWLQSFLYVNSNFYILGSESKGNYEDAILTKINSKFETKRIEGLKGLDHDFCFIDKYKRIWIGTTKGMFVLEPGSEKCKQLL
ncbi:MAG: exo-alpha-sialidase [Chitinophagaceae bacterium]|nr:exo-alpha-sialidase [Chitinophagaceae bacterium]